MQAGGWLGAVGGSSERVRLTEVMRQRDPAERRALAALHDAIVRSTTWTGLGARDASTRSATAPRARAAGASPSGRAREPGVGPAQAVMIVRDNDTAKR